MRMARDYITTLASQEQPMTCIRLLKADALHRAVSCKISLLIHPMIMKLLDKYNLESDFAPVDFPFFKISGV